MRHVLLLGSLLALMVAVVVMWAFRFERSPGLTTWGLADLQVGFPTTQGVDWLGTPGHPILRLRMEEGGKPLAFRLSIPMAPAVDGLHLRFRMVSRGLIPGDEAWQDGRFMVEWHQPQSKAALERDSIGSIRDDIRGDLQDLVVQAVNGPAIPALRLEHLGCSGEFELSDLEITAVRERSIWKIGRWFLVLGWLLWVVTFVRSWPGISLWRATCAAGIWVVMGMYFVVPGPWKIQRAMVSGFHLGGSVSDHSVASTTQVGSESTANPHGVPSGPQPSLGKLPDLGNLAIRVKQAVSQARPLLHMFLLFAPTLVFAWLLGRSPALALSAILAVFIELAQVVFGYGFDIFDIGDLASDAAGIALALWLHGVISKRLEGRRSAE